MRKNYRDWDIRYLSDVGEVKQALQQFDPWIVVSEWHLPGDPSTALLSLAATYCPQSVRVLLSGESSQTMALDSVNTAHLMIPKPYELDVICEVLDRAHSLRMLPLPDAVRAYIGQITSLPSLPSSYQALSKELDKEEPDITRVSEIINADPGVLTKVLQIANSAYFGSVKKICRAEEAVVRLGLEMVKGMVLVAGLFHSVSEDRSEAYKRMLLDAVSVAGESAKAAKLLGATRERVEEAYLCGLLHNVGRLVSMECEVIDCDDRPENESMDSCCAIGAYLLQLWYFDTPIINAVLYYKRPSRAAEGELLISSLHLGYAATQVVKQGADYKSVFDLSYLQKNQINVEILKRITSQMA
ncbi:MAG: HDOD domain-containing protein [Pontibacterium sp.]